MTAKVKVAVVMGGPSAEHDISLKSGAGIINALTARGWWVEPITVPKSLAIGEAVRWTKTTLEQCGPAAVFIALHGPFGEDGTIQQLCDELELPYTGSDAQASRIGLDKVLSRARFERAGLTVPGWKVLEPSNREDLESCAAQFGFPLVVKPTNQGSSIGISIVSNEAELVEGVRRAAEFDHRILIEQFVAGRELTVGILDDAALPPVEIRPVATGGFFDYTAKYTPGRTQYLVPADLDDAVTHRVQAAGLLAHQAVGCRHFSRIDLILNSANQPVILEVNTIPGFTATSLLPKAAACVGIEYDALCERLVLAAMRTARRPARAASASSRGR